MKAHVRRRAVSLTPPKKETYQPTISFRCPLKEHAWLVENTQETNLSMSAVTVWALGLAHEYFRILEPLNDRIEALMTAEGLTRQETVSKLLKDGLEKRRK